jgi:hypothetical protein
MYGTQDQELRAVLTSYIAMTKASGYYADANWTTNSLTSVMLYRIYNGSSINSVSTRKATRIVNLQQDDRSFITSFNRRLRGEILALINRKLYEVYETQDRLEEILASVTILPVPAIGAPVVVADIVAQAADPHEVVQPLAPQALETQPIAPALVQVADMIVAADPPLVPQALEAQPTIAPALVQVADMIVAADPPLAVMPPPQVFNISNREFRTFQFNVDLSYSCVTFILSLFQKKSSEDIFKYDQVNGNTQGYHKLLNCEFFTMKPTPNFSYDWNLLPLIHISRLRFFFIAFQSSLNQWSLLILDFLNRKLYFVNSRNVNTLVVHASTTPLLLSSYSNNIKLFLERCGVDDADIIHYDCVLLPLILSMFEPQSEINMSESGIYVLTIIEHMKNNTPMTFKQVDLINYRTRYAHEVLLEAPIMKALYD